MRAIEIYNSFCGYSPEAHRWAIEYGCAICSGTDAHNPLFLDIDYLHGKHRPVTLIFARERTSESVREALDNRRTAVLAEERLYGSEELLGGVFDAMFEISDIRYAPKKVTLTVVNRSSVPLVLKKAAGSEKDSLSARYDHISVRAHDHRDLRTRQQETHRSRTLRK